MRKIIPAVVAGAAVLAVAGGSYGYASLDKDVHLSVDGSGDEVSTMAGTVGDVLQSRGIELGEHDLVAPAPGTRLSDGTRIAVQYGRQVRVTVDGQQQLYWTTATRVGDALAGLDVDTTGAKLSTSRSTPIGREGVSFDLATRKRITIDNAGRAERVVTTAQTVAAALAAAKITVDDDDLLSVDEDTQLKDGASFSVTKVDVKTVTKKEKVEYRTRYTEDDQLEQGRSEVDTRGAPGVRRITITEVRHNGKLESREQQATLATPPRDEVVRRGTKPPPPPEPEPPADQPDEQVDPPADTPDDAPGDDLDTDPGAPSDLTDPDRDADSDADADSDTDSGDRNTVWDRLAQCESGQNWSINTGSGYYGGLQFAKQSWTGYGGTEYAELASEATREQQIAIAEKILDDVGWKAWPACSKKLGLR